MPDTIPATLELPRDVAAALEEPRARATRLLRRAVRPADLSDLFAAMGALSDDARRRGLTAEVLQAKLGAHVRERRNRAPDA